MRLNTVETLLDLAKNKVVLSEGLQVILHDNAEKDAWVYAKTSFSADEDIWVAVVDWERSRYRSGMQMYAVTESNVDYRAFFKRMYNENR